MATSAVESPRPPPLRRPTAVLRTRSSPVLPQSARFPALPSGAVHESAIDAFPLPCLIFEPSLRLHSASNAAREAFGVSHDVLSRQLGPGGAEQFFWTNRQMEGDSVTDKIRAELKRLAQRTTWGPNTSAPSALELKSGILPGLRWWAEVVVNVFYPEASEHDEVLLSDFEKSRQAPWFSVVLLRALPGKPKSGSSEQTPTLGSTNKGNPFSSWTKKQSHQVEEDDDGSEGAWTHHIPTSESAYQFPPQPPPLSIRLSTMPPIATPPLSSTSSKLSSRSSLMSAVTTSSSSSYGSTSKSTQSFSIPVDLSPAEAVATARSAGLGVSVSSSGIQMSIPPPEAVLPTSTSLPTPDPFRKGSPRPTALPPPLPIATPNKNQLLQFAALASLPNTGVIVADPELTTGFVNPLAREILLGISAAKATGGLAPEWWDEGSWFDDEFTTGFSGGSGSTSTTGFFPTSSHGDKNPFEAKDLLYSSIIADGNAKIPDPQSGARVGSLRIGKPEETNRYRTTVAGILSRSAASAEARRFGYSGPQRGAGLPHDPPPTPGGTQHPKAFTPASARAGKKPYKVFDHTWSQRIIDPLEPLLEICIRRGEQPSAFGPDQIDEGGVSSGMIVGVEVEMWDGEATFSVTTATAKRKQIRRRLVEISAAPIYEPNHADGSRGRHLGGMLLLKDVTNDPRLVTSSFKTAGPATRNGEAYFKHIIDNLPQMVWTTQPGGSHDFFNRQWYEYTNLEPEQSLGLGWQSPFHDEDTPAALKAWSHSLETGDPYSVEYRCRRYDGEWRWMLGRALPFRNAEGTIQSWFGTCTDVHDFVLMRAELAKKEEQFRAIVEGSQVVIFALDHDFLITFFEGSHAAYLTQRFGSLVGKKYSQLWPDSALIPSLQAVLDGVLPSKVVEWVPGSNDGKLYRCNLTPIIEHLPDGTPQVTGVITVAVDVTESTQLKVEGTQLRASEEAAQEASRLKSEFLANTTHELRTPVAGMIGLAELLQSEPDLKEEHRQQVAKIIRGGEILLELVGMVLDMGKVEAGKLDLEQRPFKLEVLLSDARLFSTVARKKGLEFIEEAGAIYPHTVTGDMPRLRQIISNLLSNAIKFTTRGSVTLRVAVESETSTTVLMKFEVQDTGIGVKESAIGSLFKPFHQADSSTARLYGGTGLGLCIAKNLIELMGGSIDFKSVFGTGTTASVRVPLEKSQAGIPPSPSVAQTSSSLNLVRDDKWILVVDDNDVLRDIVAKTLTKLKFNVQSASNGLEAVAAINKQHFDLIVMDGQMPEMDGYEATALIRRSPDPDIANVKIIALTASAIRGDEIRCFEAGMDDYLTKPVRAKLLEATVIKHLTSPPRTSATVPAPGPSHSSGSGSGSDSEPDSETERKRVVLLKRKLSHPSYSEDVNPIVVPP